MVVFVLFQDTAHVVATRKIHKNLIGKTQLTCQVTALRFSYSPGTAGRKGSCNCIAKRVIIDPDQLFSVAGIAIRIAVGIIVTCGCIGGKSAKFLVPYQHKVILHTQSVTLGNRIFTVTLVAVHEVFGPFVFIIVTAVINPGTSHYFERLDDLPL